MTDTCKAYQASDQMVCPCGLQWDMNDPDEPECPTIRLTAVKRQIYAMTMTENISVNSRYDALQRERLELERRIG